MIQLYHTFSCQRARTKSKRALSEEECAELMNEVVRSERKLSELRAKGTVDRLASAWLINASSIPPCSSASFRPEATLRSRASCASTWLMPSNERLRAGGELSYALRSHLVSTSVNA